MIHWLTASLLPGVAKWAIIALLGWLVKLVRAHIHVQRQIRDQLDTSKPGGLTTVVEKLDEMERKPAPRARKPKATDGGESRAAK